MEVSVLKMLKDKKNVFKGFFWMFFRLMYIYRGKEIYFISKLEIVKLMRNM